MVRPKGLEPLTYGSGGRRSIQLSYGRAHLVYIPAAPHTKQRPPTCLTMLGRSLSTKHK